MINSPRFTARNRQGAIRPGRVLLVGRDSVVSRALQLYLRKEGYDAATLSDDPLTRLEELNGTAAERAPQLVIIASSLDAAERGRICQRVRQGPRTRATPILELREAGDVLVRASGADGDVDAADASITWPFRLQEVLVAVEDLVKRAARAAAR